MTDIRTAAGALVRVAPSPHAGRAALVFVECAPWRTPGTAQLTEDEARAVRDALTELLGEPTGSAEEDVPPSLLVDAYRQRDQWFNGCSDALARATRAEECAADLMGKLAEANRARQAAEDARARMVTVLNNAEAARDRAQAEVMELEGRADRLAPIAPVTLADARRTVREAALAAYWRTEDSSAVTALVRLAEALDERL